MSNFTGNELILAHNTLQGLLKLADLLQYIQDNIQTGGSGSAITDIDLQVTDLSISQFGRFQVVLAPTPVQNLNHVRYLIVGDQSMVANSSGTVWVNSVPTDPSGVFKFSVLVVADGFSKILYCLMEYELVQDENGYETYTYSLSYRDTPYVIDR